MMKNKEYGIRDEDILGVMTSFVRNGKEYLVNHKVYRLYAVVWYFLYPLRRVFMKCKIKCRGYIILLLLLQTLVNGGAVCYALVMKKMVDSAVGQDKEGFFIGLITFGLLMLSLMLVRVVLRQLEEATRSGMGRVL